MFMLMQENHILLLKYRLLYLMLQHNVYCWRMQPMLISHNYKRFPCNY